MFGYVLPFKADLKVCQWMAYRAYYCGLCMQLKDDYGFVPRLLLNYDLVTLALTADGLAGTEPPVRACRCMANPVEKHPVCGTSPGLALAADCLVLAAYYKAADDVADEGPARRLAARSLQGLLHRAREKAAARRPDVDAVLAGQTGAQAALEARRSASPDEAAEPSAQMARAMFAAAAPPDSPHREDLARMGLFLGKILYYLDAAEDYEKDAARGAYNVFAVQGLAKTAAWEEARRLCRLCAGELARSYSRLPLAAATHKPILDNILYLGLPRSIAQAGQKPSGAREPARL